MSRQRLVDALDRWFSAHHGAPSEIQRLAWPALRAGEDALLVAATGQGKTLAAWRPLVERIAGSPSTSSPSNQRRVRALHIAPLKALARDMTLNLAPFLDQAAAVAGTRLDIALRCGDTAADERRRQRIRPPAILSTTPESLFVLLGTRAGRDMLAGVEAVVLDELHVLAAGKRGAHLALSLERLDALLGRRAQRVGLSATAGSPETLAAFLSGGRGCRTLKASDVGHRDRAAGPRIDIELPPFPLGSFCTLAVREHAWDRIAALAAGSSAMLLFCATRGEVERSAAALAERLGEDAVGAHHGSLDRAHREVVEARFRDGGLRLMVSSASLELGLDLGRVDRVAQFGVPGQAGLLRQRAGRSNHRPGARPRIHVFPLTVHQLIEIDTLKALLSRGRSEPVVPPVAPLDVLAQHLVALIDSGESDVDALARRVRGAWPYRAIDPATIERVLEMLAETPSSVPDGQCRALVARTLAGEWRSTSGAGRLVRMNAGVIPEFFEYEVVRADDGGRVGRLDEEFAFESSVGQVVQLGRYAWRIVRVQPGRVLVEPADEPATSLPFWFGEGAGRSDLVAAAMRARIEAGRVPEQARTMLDQARAELGRLPGPDCLVIERFRDPGGDAHLVVHSFAGVRINRAWGLALRKRFCRQFNFELQAAATDDGVLISLGVTSCFEPAEVAGFVRSHNVRDVLIQALLDTPLFVTRFRWAANNALKLLRRDIGGAVPAPRQRSATENLIACVFPDQLACLENLNGPRQVPDHPLVTQALADCMHEHMDLAGLEALLGRIESGALAIHAVDRETPSALAQALIHAPRHSFLDEAAAEERRTRAFESVRSAPRSGGSRTTAAGAPRSQPLAAPERTARPEPGLAGRLPAGNGVGAVIRRATADELEALLLRAGFLVADEGEAGLGLAGPLPPGGWTRAFSQLLRERRAVSVEPGPVHADGPRPQARPHWRPQAPRLWVAVPRLDWLQAVAPALKIQPWLAPALWPRAAPCAGAALARLIEARSHIEGGNAESTVTALFGTAAVVHPRGQMASADG